MSDAQALYAEKVTDTTATSTSWVEVCKITAANFTAGKKYLIIANAYLASSSATNDARARLVHGATPTEFVDSLSNYDYTTVTTQRTCAGWLFVWDQPGTAEDVILQISSSSTNTTTCAMGQIFCLKLSDDFTTDDWKYTEVLTDYTTTASRADCDSTEAASVTFTPNGTDDWLIIGQFYLTGAATNSNYQGSLFDSVEGVDSPLIDIEGEDTTNDLRSHLMMRVFTPTAVSHTFQLRFSHESVAHTIKSSRIFALNLNKLAQHGFSYAAADDTPAASPSWTTTRTLSPTPSATGNWFIMGYLGNDIGTNSDNLAVRLQINPSGGGLASDPAYGDDAPGTDAFDPSDVLPFSIFKLVSLTSGAARDINLGVQRVAGTTVTVQDRCLVAFSVALAASTTAITGRGAGAASGVAALLGAGALVGKDSIGPSAEGSLLGAGALVGADTAVSSAVGSLDGLVAVNAQDYGAASGVAALTGSGALTDVDFSAPDAIGQLLASGTLAGQAAGEATGVASLLGQGSLSGTTSGTAATYGDLQVVSANALEGISAGAAFAYAALLASGALAGQAAGETSAQANLVGAGALVGQSVGESDARSAGTASGVLAGQATGVVAAYAQASGAGALVGRDFGEATSVAALLGTGALAGNVFGAATTFGNLSGAAQGAIFGQSAGYAFEFGDVTATGQLAGIVAGESSALLSLPGFVPPTPPIALIVGGRRGAAPAMVVQVITSEAEEASIQEEDDLAVALALEMLL